MKETSRTKSELLAEIAILNKRNKLLEKLKANNKHLSHKLQESEDRCNALLNNSIDAILLTAPDGRILSANPEACRIFGRSEEEICRMGRNGVLDSMDPRLKIALAERERTGQFRGELTFIRKDGTHFPGEISTSIFKDRAGNLLTSMIIRDITDRKQAEKRLFKSEKKFSLSFQINPNPMAISDVATWKYIDVNQAFIKWTGFLREEVIGKSAQDLHLWVNEEDSGKLLDSLAATGEISNEDILLRQKSGSVRNVLFSGRFIEIEQEHYVLTLAHDITERKRAEELLQSSYRFLNDIIDFLPDATFVIDRNGRVITWNRSIEKITGISKSDIIGRGNYEYAIPFYGQRRSLLIDLALLSDEAFENSNYNHVSKDGDILCAEAYVPKTKKGKGAFMWGMASKLRDASGNIIGAIESIRDITERQYIEKKLQESEKQYRTFFSTSRDCVFISTTDGRLIEMNDAGIELFGYSNKNEILQMDLFDLYEKKEDRRKYINSILEEGYVKDYRVNLRRKDGKMIQTLITSTVQYDVAGNVIGSMGTIKDITERQRAEEERERLQAQLMQAQKMEAVGTLAAVIAHDFNNILGGLIGYTEMSLLHIGMHNPLVKQYLEQIRNGTQRAADLVKQILTFSRKTDREIRPIKVIPILKETIKLIRAAIPPHIEIVDIIEAERDLILADPTGIHQVLMNLCTNAAQAMLEKGGVLKIGVFNVYLDEHSGISGDIKKGCHLQITVGDTGPGINVADIDHIFDPFFTTKKPGEGTGLGLAVVHGIVQSLKGGIIVRSLPDKGTTFEIDLPLIDEQKDILQNNLEKTYVGGKEQILFVDDEENIARVYERMLKEMGYNVLATTSCAAAIGSFKLQPDHFDIVITDQIMPEMLGTEMIAELVKIRPDIPVIICTGFMEITSQCQEVLSRIDSFIMKPCTMSTLDATIRKVMLRRK